MELEKTTRGLASNRKFLAALAGFTGIITGLGAAVGTDSILRYSDHLEQQSRVQNPDLKPPLSTPVRKLP